VALSGVLLLLIIIAKGKRSNRSQRAPDLGIDSTAALGIDSTAALGIDSTAALDIDSTAPRGRSSVLTLMERVVARGRVHMGSGGGARFSRVQQQGSSWDSGMEPSSSGGSSLSQPFVEQEMGVIHTTSSGAASL
jgi:hypothetical protein